MITFTDVTKALEGFQLKPLSFQIPDGCLCALAGPNGSGKTTLLHLLLGLYHPKEGSIFIDEASYDLAEKKIRDSIGTVLSEELFNPGLSAEKNGDHYGRFFSRFEKETYLSYLTQFQIDHRKKFIRLSKGEKLKCQFAFALACHPKYLVLDEPAANFDPEFRETFMKLLQEFISDGKRTAILASHLTEDLDLLADYLIYMEKGRAVFTGDLEEFRSSYRILSGEAYKLKLFDKNLLISMEEKPYGAKALVRHHNYNQYDKELSVTFPSIAEFMYFHSKSTC